MGGAPGQKWGHDNFAVDGGVVLPCETRVVGLCERPSIKEPASRGTINFGYLGVPFH